MATIDVTRYQLSASEVAHLLFKSAYNTVATAVTRMQQNVERRAVARQLETLSERHLRDMGIDAQHIKTMYEA